MAGPAELDPKAPRVEMEVEFFFSQGRSKNCSAAGRTTESSELVITIAVAPCSSLVILATDTPVRRRPPFHSPSPVFLSFLSFLGREDEISFAFFL